MPVLKIDIPEDLLHSLNENENAMGRIMKLFTAMQFYRERKLSLGQAAELADIPKDEFMRECGRHGIPAINYPSTDLHDEIKSLG
jgi:predicted HTH domain antitoxin